MLAFVPGWRRYEKEFSKSNVSVKDTGTEDESGCGNDIDQPESISHEEEPLGHADLHAHSLNSTSTKSTQTSPTGSK